MVLYRSQGKHMPRKSRKLRLQQAQELHAAWAQSPFANDYRHRFIGDMISRLERDRGTSTKQRNWLDQLIEDGVPVPEDVNMALVEQCNAAIAAFTSAGHAYEWENSVVADFRKRVAAGKDLSEKQAKFLNGLIATATELTEGKEWKPSEEEVVDLKHAVKLYRGYATLWKNDRPGVHRALVSVVAYLNDGAALKQRDASKLLKAVGAKLRKVKDPRWKSGDIGKLIRGAHRHDPAERVTERLVCMSETYVTEDGLIVNDWLSPAGNLVTLSVDRVMKR